MMVGAGVASAVGTARAIPAVVAGCLVLYVIGVRHGIEGLRARAPMGKEVVQVLGTGTYSATFTGVIMLATVGWCGFYAGLGGAALSDLLSVPQVAGAGLIVLVCLGLALTGQNTWNVLVYVTAACAVALSVLTVASLGTSPPTGSQSGSLIPNMVTGLGAVIAYAIVFTMRVPDFTSDLRAERDVWLAGIMMLFPMLILMSVGIWLYGRTGLFDMAGVLRRTDRAALGQMLLAVSAIAPAVTAIYSSAISFDSIKRVPHRTALTTVAVIAFALGAARFDLKLLGFLQALGAVVPPALAVMLLHPHVRPKPSPSRSFAAFIVGSFCALLLRTVAPFWGFVAGFSVTTTLIWTTSLSGGKENEVER
jgi:hypothetical protein